MSLTSMTHYMVVGPAGPIFSDVAMFRDLTTYFGGYNVILTDLPIAQGTFYSTRSLNVSDIWI